MNNNLSDLTFEQALIALEQTVEQLDSGKLSLEESLALFESGQQLTVYCENLLEQAALKVE